MLKIRLEVNRVQYLGVLKNYTAIKINVDFQSKMIILIGTNFSTKK